MSVYGCSQSANMNWIKSKLTLKMQSTSTAENKHSLFYHQRGPFGLDHVTIHFCSKMADFQTSTVKNIEPIWPTGKYCIFKMADACPQGKKIIYIVILTFITLIFWWKMTNKNLCSLVKNRDGKLPYSQIFLQVLIQGQLTSP